jgi:SPP1 family predicted phage head-tail adaptor
VDIYNIHTITLNTSGGYSTANVPNAASSTTIQGYINRGKKLTMSIEGESVTSMANVTIDYNNSITTEDTVTFDGKTWRIIAINHLEDFTRKLTRLVLL